jgi:hypothetical protein
VLAHTHARADAAHTSAQVYGAGTETLVMDEDAQTLEARSATGVQCLAPASALP